MSQVGADEVHASPLTQMTPAAAEAAAAALRNKQAISAARQFTKLYYESMDKGRTALNALYHDESKMTWNGNSVAGKAAILNFFAEQLPVTETTLLCFDAQSVSESLLNPTAATSGQQATILVTCSGTQKIGIKECYTFTQSFLLAAENNKWKIASDSHRFLV